MSLHQFSSEETILKDDLKTSKSQYPIFVLDEDSIYLYQSPHEILYQLSSSPKRSQTKEYTMKKSRGSGDVASSELFHIKDESETVPEISFGLVTIRDGHGSKAKPVDLVSSAQTWSTCSAAGHFKVEYGIIDRVKGREERKWKDEGGRLSAIEAREKHPGASGKGRRSTLTLHVTQTEEDVDLLVACWTARVWKESNMPSTWKRIRSAMPVVVDTGNEDSYNERYGK